VAPPRGAPLADVATVPPALVVLALMPPALALPTGASAKAITNWKNFSLPWLLPLPVGIYSVLSSCASRLMPWEATAKNREPKRLIGLCYYCHV
jgi:hypothetical protein